MGTGAPLERLTEAEVKHLLRWFSDTAISSALALRTGSNTDDFKSCLFGILIFYLPQGTTVPDFEPSVDTRIRDDLGLDSLSMAEAMFKIEELFDIRVENTEILEIITISDACCLLVEKLETTRPGA